MERLIRNIFAFSGHFLAGLIIISFHKIQEKLQLFSPELIVSIVVIYLLILILMYLFLHSKLKSFEEKEKMRQRSSYSLLSGIIDSISQAIRDRLATTHMSNNLLLNIIKKGDITEGQLADILEQFEGEKRYQINTLFKNVCHALKRDMYGIPNDPDKFPEDVFKVSYYRKKEVGGRECLVPAYRAYPHEGYPKTPEIPFGEAGGGAGLAWKYGKIIVISDVENDERWVDFRDHQKAEYASMICIPVIMDIPKEALREIHGVLTIDSRIRRNFFEKRMEKLWEDITYPISYLLLLITESEKRNELLMEALQNIVNRGMGDVHQ